MSPLEFIGLVSVGVFGPEYLVLRKKENLVSIGGAALMCGIIALGVLEFARNPVTYAGGTIIWGFAPHAYNLILWPVAALLLLRPKFGAVMMLPALLFGYGMDELIWNGFATARFAWMKGAFGPQGILWYTVTSYWEVFIVGMAAITVVGYLLLRPKVKVSKNAGLVTMLMFISFWAFLGFPDGATNWYTTFWELAWQGVYWFFFLTTFSPRDKA